MEHVLARIEVIKADITTLDVDAIVNAANEALAPGGGVCGAIFRAAGPELDAACRKIGGCPTGEARITDGYGLPARHVIHAVGPVWRGGGSSEPELLASCYRNALALCRDHEIETVAFPAISTGIYGYPKADAAAVAVQTVAGFLADNRMPAVVTLCCFDAESVRLYEDEIGKLTAG